MPERLAAVSNKKPFVHGPGLSLHVERQSTDTLLPDAGVPLEEGNFYYGLHIHKPREGTSFAKSVATGLVVIAKEMPRTQEKWLREKYGEPPQLLVGVTYGRLAEMARRLLNFEFAPLPAESFNESHNSEVGWDQYAQGLQAAYQETQPGKRGVPIDYGVTYTEVGSFVSEWEAADLDMRKRPYLDPDQLRVKRIE